jgi:HB1, ASXL, restriction endonuclease HTH domain
VATDSAKGIAAAADSEQPVAPPDMADAEWIASTEHVQEPTATAPEPITTEPEPTATEPTSEPTAQSTEETVTEEATTEQVTVATEPTVGQTGSSTEPKQSTAKPQRKTPTEPTQKRVSALDAAAPVLAEEARPMNCKELITAMAAKGYWTSPGGKPPDATLYSAILRELDTKATEACFVKAERGKFARKS